MKPNSTLLFLIHLFYLLPAFHLNAAPNETLPTYHWAYRMIAEVQQRGFCLDLPQANMPWVRGEIAASLINAEKKLKIDREHSLVQQLFQSLREEFRAEMKVRNPDSPREDRLLIRGNFRANLDEDEDKTAHYRGTYRGGLGVALGSNVYAFNGVNFNQYDYADASYYGYKWRGIAGYTEQAYIAASWQRFRLRLGRDFLKWGVGESGTLILSGIAQPFDHLLASADFGPFRFTFFASELDNFSPVFIDSVRIPVRRFLSGHRLDLHFWQGRIQAALSELMLYGGPNATFSTIYSNPVIFYHGEHKNKASYLGNVLPTIDLLVYPLRNWQLYGSLLIDDFQIEKQDSMDLEPNEIGWLIGTKWADVWRVNGLTLSAEYVRIANRTYKTPDALETFTFRNRPLGHPLGNDFDHWQIGVGYRMNRDWHVEVVYSKTRHGEGSIKSPWDAPWLKLDVADGYSEPFPTGMVEKTSEFKVTVWWFMSRHIHLYGVFCLQSIDNWQHKLASEHQATSGKVTLEIDLMQCWDLGKSN
ncbi:hypothetical protein JXJ21_09040 [candidate division KSB1 bacterium]|nr:hypothetical protein [candidate division KSB1 bacterium]